MLRGVIASAHRRVCYRGAVGPATIPGSGRQRPSLAIGFALALSLVVRLNAQEGASTAPAARSRPPLTAETLPLLPAPRSSIDDASTSPTDEEPRASSPSLSARTQTQIAQVRSAPVAPREPKTDQPLPNSDLVGDVAKLRAETAERLRQLDMDSASADLPAVSRTGTAAERSPSGKETKSVSPPGPRAVGEPAAAAVNAPIHTTHDSEGARKLHQELRALLADRQLRLDEHDQLVKELRELTHPKLSPEREIAASHAQLEQLKDQLTRAPQDLISPVFKKLPAEVTDDNREEMKQLIAATRTELRDWQSKLEGARADQDKAASEQNSLRAERDRLFQQVAALKASVRERATVGVGKDGRARMIAQERQANARLEARIAELQLEVAGAKLDREEKRKAARELTKQVLSAHVQLTKKRLDLIQARDRALAESRQRELEKAAATAQSKAQQADDPLERYRSRRLAEHLELEARVIKYEQALATGAPPTLEEQRGLADRADSDFAQIKQLLVDGNVSRLDALRLNNDFRRIGPERGRLLRNELAAVETQLQFYENTLTGVELELIEDSLADQVEHDTVLDQLTPGRHAQALSDFQKLDKQHRALLLRQKTALTALVARSSETLEQVNRRLHILEEEYGFIRTNIFWVRDQEPIGLGVVKQAGRELKRLVKGMLRLAQDCTQSKAWGPPSSEFLSAITAVVVLPLGLIRLRRVLRRRISRALPPSHLHGSTAPTIRLDRSGPLPKS